jgi:predicted ATP-grasp superfamily ATP-dependent carboligase
VDNSLIIIGANDFQNQLILKAKALGYETHVFAWKDGAVGRDTADFFYPISIIEKEEILTKCCEIKPCGVCSIASDLASITVNYVAENLGLPCNKTKYSEIQTNKYKMRAALQKAGIPCPIFVLADNIFDPKAIADYKFPIIVKPTDRSGSRSVMKLESLEGLEEAIQRACQDSFENKAIIEEYIEGDEYSMETISYQGEHHYLATTKKYTTGAPHFIETGHIQPSGLPDEIIDKAKQIVFCALDALHVENSAGHSEFKVDQDGNIRIIEIGARMGGDCIGSDLVYLSTGNDFVKMVIDVACGNKPESIKESYSRKAEIRFIFTQNDLDELEEIKKTNPYSIYRISDLELENLGNTTDSSSRVGYFIILDGIKNDGY